MKNLIVSVLFFAFTLQSSMALPMTGHEGNGGDNVEGFFIAKGSNLLAKLSRTDDGRKFLQELPVPIYLLYDTLDHRRITVYNGVLMDRTGGEVDAVVEEGIIYLNRDNWLDHIGANIEVDRLVLHEMLRSAGVNDDNYKYSKNVGMIGDLLDLREAMSLSRYINPAEIKIKLAEDDSVIDVDTFTYVNNVEMKLEISGSSLIEHSTTHVGQERLYLLNIPIHNTGETKIIIYRVDYEYVNYMKQGAVLQSDRSVRFQSTESVERKDQDIKGREGTNVTIIDLLSLQSAYKEGLQLRINNRIAAPAGDTSSYMELNRIVIHFNILRL